MTAIIVSIIVLLVSVLGLGYFLWALHERTEKLSSRLGILTEKVNEGEDVIIENFNLVQKSFAKLEHEISEVKKIEPRLKEIIRTTSRAKRVSDSTSNV